MKTLEEFKKFAVRGNVIDLAIGVMIGSSFNNIVSSLVNDIIMPPIGYMIGGMTLNQHKILLKPAVINAKGKMINEAIYFNYGNFSQILLNFIIIAFAMFMVVKVMNKIRERMDKKAGIKAENAPPPEEVLLLREIRDDLKKNQSEKK